MDGPLVSGPSTAADVQVTTEKRQKAMDIGAPAQHAQPSRKGKKAWRKNVNITEIEAAVESMREEERLTGGKLQHRSNQDLFTIDVTGDELIQKRVQKEKKPLRFLQILQQRSAVPAIHSRVGLSDSVKSRKMKFSGEEKSRLLRKARKLRQGALNSSTENGSAVVEPRISGQYDVWGQEGSDEERLVKKMKTDEAREYVLPVVKKPKVKPPKSVFPSKHIRAEAVETPHPGTSYNPLPTAHNSLLKTAHEIELERQAAEEKDRLAREKAEMMKSVRIDPAEEDVENIYKGMKIDVPKDVGNDEELEEEDGEKGDVLVRKPPRRKTKAQRNREGRTLAKKRDLEEALRKKQFRRTVFKIKSITKEVDSKLAASRKAAIVRAKQKRAEKKGLLTGKKVGKHVVMAKEVDVQLKEEMSENLRELQPEGNLFRDRFLSLQSRALVEPRKLVLPKRRVKYKDYEKHPWKRFQ